MAPRKPAARKRSSKAKSSRPPRSVTIRFTEKEYQGLKALADADRRSMADQVRYLLDVAVTKATHPSGGRSATDPFDGLDG